MTPSSPAADVLPPVDPSRAIVVAAVGAGICAAAALLSVIPYDDGGMPRWMSTGRLVLVASGALTSAFALSWRPDLWLLWLIGSATAVLASVGLPASTPGAWDSAKMLARVLAGCGIAGAVLRAAPANVRHLALSAFALFHFGGLLTATTWPETNGTPPPWTTNIAATHVYTPYFKFLYMSNAYHFYSPEPGPASHLFVLLQYELKKTEKPDKELELWKAGTNPDTGETEWTRRSFEWVDVPNRREHYKDPLGLSYYRRLSVTEMVSQAYPSRFTGFTFEKSDAVQRRRMVSLGQVAGRAAVPLVDRAGPEDLQYRIPRADITRYLLPSYARHIATEYTAAGRTVIGMKIFRVEHSILAADEFLGRRIPFTADRREPGADPYHPATYRPYFLGEYDASGRLLDPTDPMLYWLCPILTKPADVSDPKKRTYEDFMSKYAGREFDWEGRDGR